MTKADTRSSQTVPIRNALRILRSHWVVVAISTFAGAIAAAVITLTTTPQYQATTRLFVSTTAGASASELYQGNRLSQERVLSYTELIEGRTLAQRTIDKLNLDMTAEALQKKVKASAKLETVLISMSVTDPSPIRARDIANALSDEFVVLVRELETPRVGAQPDARVVVEERASIPESPVVPLPAQNAMFGLLIGLLAGIGLAFLRDNLDNTVKSQETLEALTQTGTVGIVPLDKSRCDQPAISFSNDSSASAESFRKLRTNLHFLAVDNPPRMIVLTSSVPGEGKSTTSINLALTLADAGHNVLLVDGDMRRPAVAKYLDVIGPVGLSTVLSGGTSVSEALQESRYPRLTILTAGTTPPNPSELLASNAAKALLHELREMFDYVIIDSPPLLAVTDAAVLAVNSDGALIMARFGQTKRDQIGQAVRMLEDVAAPLLGAVLTMVPMRGRGGHYGYQYSHYSYDSGKGQPRSANKETSSRGERSVASDLKPLPRDT